MLEEYKIFDLIKFRDQRGYFYESFSRLLDEKLKKDFVQDNISFSQKGVIRGLHYQWDNTATSINLLAISTDPL